MGIWNTFKEILQEKQSSDNGKDSNDREEYPLEDISDNLKRMPASKTYRTIVLNLYYRGYPEKPFISKDREKNTNWLEQAELMPKQSVIPIEVMTRFADGLLPGHVYMLYWLHERPKAKRIPSFFEYKYGVNFVAEKEFLLDNGYLNQKGLTPKGVDAINMHYDIVEKHSPERTSAKKAKEKYADAENICVEQEQKKKFEIGKTYSINGRNLMIVSKYNKELISSDLELVNNLLQEMRRRLGIKDKIMIPVDELKFNRNFSGKLYSYFEYTPFTPTGRTAKCPISLHFCSEYHAEPMPEFDSFGCVLYNVNNEIIGVNLNCWNKAKGHHVDLGLIDGKLSVKKVDLMENGKKTTIYRK